MLPNTIRMLNKPKCSNCAKADGCRYIDPTGTACGAHVHKAMKPCECGNADVRLSVEVTAATPEGVFIASCAKCGKRVSTSVSFADCIATWNTANEF